MKTNKMTPWQRFTGLLQLDKRDIKQVFLYAIFTGFVALSVPLGIQAIINLIQVGQITTSWIVLVVLVTLGVAFQGVLQLMQIRILENIKQKIFTRSSFEFAYRFPKIKMSSLKYYYPPELANRFFDTLTVQKGLSKVLIDFPSAAVQIALGLILLSLYHPFFIFYGLLLITLIYLVFRYTGKKGLETSLNESKSKYKVAHWIQEIARSLISFKLSGKTKMAMDRNNALTDDYLENREKHFKILLIQFAQLIGFKVFITAGLLIIGGLLVINQQMNIGQFVASEIIILLVISSVEKLILNLETFYDVLTSLEKIGQVVDKELEKQEGLNPFHNNEELTIELDNVSYTAENGKNIFNGVTSSFNKDERVLLNGVPGSGKTTFLKLLSGLIEPDSGNIFINNASLKGTKINSYRSYVGQMLPEQKPFEGTIRDNITLGDDTISITQLNEVIKIAGLLDFIKNQQNGIDTVLYPEGQQIPYTISRRIVFARAIVNKPKVLLLKDPFNQFDQEETKKLIEFVTHKKQPWLLIVSSNNKEWNSRCSRVINLENNGLTV
ncbi:peptidase domain-containing ABC transporter [Pseudofulvibacter geojedonensis]|uniref:Peptidase domain-containing ABC transporter n=1 Tax=Pseudofulvibacter geojedonensis TaxID=1123758 RepID=A0ABW3I4K0_9FLAO